MTKTHAILAIVFCFLAVDLARADAATAIKPLEPVVLQLKWLHQFQFAGYYAAKAQGYYAEEGLDVEIKPRDPKQDYVQQVLSGQADYGTGDSGLIAHYANGQPLLALAAIFQHDPLALFSKQTSGIISPYEMAGKRIMYVFAGEDNAPVRAMLAEANLKQSDYTAVDQSLDNNDFIADKVDLISGYLTDRPFEFQQKGIKVNIINPQSYGIDFYGDLLFTTRRELAEHPGRAERFRRASLKGWQYALDHPEEIIRIIHDQYRSKLTLEHLRFEAAETRKLIVPDNVPLGQIDPARLRRVASLYERLELAPPMNDNQILAFVHRSDNELNLSADERAWLTGHRSIRVGIDRDFAPYEWLDQNGNYLGMIAEHLQLLQQRLGVEFELVKNKSWQQVLDMAKRGEIDMIAAAVRTPDRAQFLDFTQAYVNTPAIIIADQSSGYIGTLQQLNGKRVAIEQGYFIQELLARDHPEIKQISAQTVTQALLLLAEGKADAYIGDAASASYAIKKLGLLHLRFAGQTPYISESRMAAVKAQPQLVGILDKALTSIPRPEREAIINRWMGLNVHQGISLESLSHYLFAAMLTLLMFVYWVSRLRQEVRARRRSEADLTMLYSNMSLGFALHEVIRDEHGTIVDYRYLAINPAFEAMTGLAESDYLGKSTKQRLPDSQSRWIEHFTEVEATAQPKHFDHYAATPKRWFITDCYQASAERFVVLLQDITDRKRDELALKASEERLRISQHYGGVATWEYDMHHNRQSWSEIVNQGLDVTNTENPTWSHFLATVCKEDRSHVVEAMRNHLQHDSRFDVEYRINVSDRKLWMRSAGQVERDPNGKPLRMLGIVHDISQRKQAEEKLRLSARVFSDAHEGIVITDVNTLIIDVNAAFSEITGYSRDEVLGKNPSLLKSGRQGSDFYAAMWRAINDEGHWQGEVWNRKKDGATYAELLTISALRDQDNRVINYIGLFSDITESKYQQQALELLAHYDPLTNLPNRSLFADRFNQAIAHSKRTETLLAVCYLDLDGFKQVNDTFGHEVGDELLIEVSRRIKLSLRECDTVCRLGGDEFALLLENLQSPQQCEETMKRIHAALADPFAISDRPIRIAASSGITLYPLDREEPDTLLRHADQAMYQAKLAGRNCYRIYQNLLDLQIMSQYQHFGRLQEALGELQEALTQNQLRLFYQPKVNLASGEVFGAEALIRWQHPQRGLLLPSEFLPIADSTPLEIEISNWVIRQSFQQLQSWLDQGLRLQVSINVSPRFLLWQNFLIMLESVLAEYPAISSRQLELEILESSVLDDLISVGEILAQCYHRLGIGSALDDFGTGYSSLTHLRHLTINSVKIDQSFVRNMIDDPDDQAIVESVIGLAKAFKREVIAEGVEDIDHGIFLINLGCDQAQGHAISKPMPAEAVLPWVGQYTNPPAWTRHANNPPNAWQKQIVLLTIQQRHWLQRVHAASTATRDDHSQWPITSAKRCYLGKWLARAKLDDNLDQALLQQLAQNLDRQCALAEKARQQHQSGDEQAVAESLLQLKASDQAISNTLRQLLIRT